MDWNLIILVFSLVQPGPWRYFYFVARFESIWYADSGLLAAASIVAMKMVISKHGEGKSICCQLDAVES